MYIKAVSLNNFRNYSLQQMVFNKQVNVFHGGNAQGKTNLAEALFYLLVARSFRTNKDHELIFWDKDFFFLKGMIKYRGAECAVEIGFQLPKRFQIKINGSEKKRSDYFHFFPVVAFGPDDLLLIKEGPSGRRHFLNLEISRLKPSYYGVLKNYQRVLQQRNRLLKAGNRYNILEQLQPWDRSLALYGSKIIKERIIFLRDLEKEGQLFFRELTAGDECLSLQYYTNIDLSPEKKLEAVFYDFLRSPAIRKQELRRGVTLVGPHLDDFKVIINRREARIFASQGQQRTAALALKLGEVKLFNLFHQEKPVIILDDVFSEFDLSRCKQLLNFLLKEGGQSFITTAAPFSPFINFLNADNSCDFFTVREGAVGDERS